MSTIDAILLGGGVGRRFSESTGALGTPLPKQFQMLGTAPVFIHAVRAFARLGCVRQVIFTVPKNFMALAAEQVEKYWDSAIFPIRVVEGGDRRQDSSRLALEAVENQNAPLPTRVFIHDACRPYLSKDFLERIRTALFDRSYGAWVPVVPVIETLKRVENNLVLETVDRNLIHRVQTPQVFEFSVIRSLVQQTESLPELNFTDDASLCEYYGIPVGVFAGDVRNIKLTYDFELDAMGSMMETKAEPCDSESDTTFTV